MNKLTEALRHVGELTRSGRLEEATAAIQQALSSSLPLGVHPGLHEGLRSSKEGLVAGADIIDVDARIVTDKQSSPGAERHAPEPIDATAATAANDLPAPGSFSASSFANAAGRRDYKLYRPRQQAPQGRATALVVMLHGCTQNPDDFAAGTRMNALAEERGWWVLYPAQAASANGSGCWNWFKTDDQQRAQGEPAILAGMTRAVLERCGLGPAQVFVAGLSAGGAMAVTLAATHPDLYAAVGVHSGLPHGSAHDLMSALTAMRQGGHAGAGEPHRVPTIVFHGDKDTTVHPCNGVEVIRQAREAAAPAPDDAGPYEVERSRAPRGHAYTRTLHRDARGEVDAEHWVVHGAGHAWSGGSSKGSYTDPKGPNASAEMLRFFGERQSL